MFVEEKALTRTGRPDDGLKYYTDEELTLKQMHDDIERRYNAFGSIPAAISPLNFTSAPLTYPATYTYTVTTSNGITTYSDGTNTWPGIEELLGKKPAEPMSLLMQEILAEEEAQAGRNDYDRIMVHGGERKEHTSIHKRRQPQYEKTRHAK